MGDEYEQARDAVLDHDLDLVPLFEREDTVERIVHVRQEVPRCAAYTRRYEQCPHRGVPTFVSSDPNNVTTAPLCSHHRAKLGLE